jgi:hypothetical protein
MKWEKRARYSGLTGAEGGGFIRLKDYISNPTGIVR